MLTGMTNADVFSASKNCTDTRSIPHHTCNQNKHIAGDLTAVQNKSKLIALEDRNSKLEYQILHLKRAVKEGDTAAKAAQPQH